MFKGARLKSVGSYLSKDLHVYSETKPGYGKIIDDGIEVDVDNGYHILDMDIDDGRGAWEWYQYLSSEDKTIVDAAIEMATQMEETK
jgi:hypothetical protein